MKDFLTKEGKYGVIYLIAEGITVSPSRQGTWEACINHKGKRDRIRFGKDLDRAVQYSELMAAKLGLTVTIKKEEQVYTVELAAQDWIRTNRHSWTPNTLERYTGILRDYVRPAFGGKAVEKVTRPAVKDFLADVLAIRSPKHVEVVHTVVSGIFNEAIDRGYTRENPAHGLLKKLLPPKRRRAQSRPDPFNKQDLGKVLDAGWKHLREPLALIIETMACSGMRLGECLAMHRDRLDVANCQYMIFETVLKKGDMGSTTKGGDERLIDMEPENVKKLEAYILKLKKEALSEGGDVGYLFYPKITQRIVQRAVRRACLAAKVRVRSPHDLRHTYATLLLMDHYSPAYVQKQLGHHSITMTVDIYGHWIPGEGRKDLGKTLKGKPSSSADENRSAEPDRA